MTLDSVYNAYLERMGLSADSYSYLEGLTVAVAREMPEGSFAFVGTGLPLLAAGLAQRTHAPNMTIILEAGAIGPTIRHIPISVADPRAAYKAATLSTLVDAFGTIASRGFCTLGVLGAAECDMYGNLNSTSLDGYFSSGVSETGRGPGTRFTGSGGANDIASIADKTVAMMVHEKRRFPERVEYLTTPAGMRGPKGENRFDCGLFRGGDCVIISDLCKMRPDSKSGVLYATEIFPGVDPEDIRKNTGWEIDISRLTALKEPTWEELRILRMEVDPDRHYLGRKKK